MRLHSLDGLRAIAASLVLLNQLGGASLGTASWPARLIGSTTASGVELFFVLSAVVLGRRFIREGRPLHVQDYFRRRVERLWPPYLVAWLLAGATIMLMTVSPTWWSVSASLPAFDAGEWLAQVFILNWWAPYYNVAWWSLNVEVAFYTLLPLLIPLFRLIRSQPVLLTMTLVATVALALGAHNALDVPVITELASYASCFAAGLILSSSEVSARVRRGAMLLGFGWVFATLTIPSLNQHIGWGLVYFGLVASAMDQQSDSARLFSSNLLVWLGERSYSLFLTHYSVITLTCWAVSYVFYQKGATYFLVTRAVAITLSLLVAMALFMWVERRFATGLVTGDSFFPSFEKTSWARPSWLRTLRSR